MDTISFNSNASRTFQIISKTPQNVLNRGDIIRGKIVSVENNMALLKLSDGSSFTVKFPAGLEIEKNAVITLEISDFIEGQLTAKILSIIDLSDNVSTENLSNLLLDNQEKILSPESELIKNTDGELLNEIVQKIISQNEKPSEKLVLDVINVLKAESGLTVEQATFAAINNIRSDSEMGTEMLKMVKKISEHEFQLTNSLNDLKNLLQQEILKADISVREEIIKTLVLENYLETMISEIQSDFPQVFDVFNKPSVKDTLIKLFINGNLNGNLIIEDNINSNIEKLAVEAYFIQEAQGFEKELGTEVVDKLLTILHKAAEKIHTQESNTRQNPENEIKTLLDSLFDKVTVDFENETSDSFTLKQKAKSLSNIMELSKQIMDRLNLHNESITFQTFNEIDLSFRFFSQLTSYNYFVQLPVKFNNEETTGNLYVMKRKNRNKLDLDDFTLLISLKTKALGEIEGFINSKNKRISINFRLEKEELSKLFKDNYMSLYEGLLKRGYKLIDFKCRLLEKERTNILNAHKKAEEYLGLKTKVDLKI